MTNIAYIDNKPGDWDRGPDRTRATQVRRLQQRRAALRVKVIKLLSRRTVGPERALPRWEKLAALHNEYCRLGALIVERELL